MKKFKGVMAIGLTAAMLFSFTGCGTSFSATDKKTFESALEDKDILDLDDDEYSSQKGDDLYGVDGCTRDIWYYGDDFYIEYREFDETEDAYDYFEDCYDDFEDDMDDENFEGSSKSKISDTTGYIILDGEGDDGDFVGDDDIYGGLYFKDNTVVYVLVRSDKDKDQDKVDDFLDAIGYPKP